MADGRPVGSQIVEIAVDRVNDPELQRWVALDQLARRGPADRAGVKAAFYVGEWNAAERKALQTVHSQG
jgi:hypothetical protein